MIKNFNGGAQTCAHSIPHVYDVHLVRQHLPEDPVRYVPRAIYQGTPISVTMTLTEVVFDPPQIEALADVLIGLERCQLLSWRRFLGETGCDMVQLDGRMLLADDATEHAADFFRVSLLKSNNPLVQTPITPRWLAGDPNWFEPVVAVGLSNAHCALPAAIDISASLRAARLHPENAVVDGVLWMCEGPNQAPSFLVPVHGAKHQSSEQERTSRCRGARDRQSKAAQAYGPNAQAHKHTKPVSIVDISRRPTSATILSECRRLAKVDDILPWLDREITYVGYPVLAGIEIAVNLSADGFNINIESDDANDVAWLSELCNARSEQLTNFFERVKRALPSDSVRLDGRIVPDTSNRSSRIIIYRTVVFAGGVPVLECPYNEDLFEADEKCGRHLFAWMSERSAAVSFVILNAITTAAAAMARAREVEISGVLWLPVNHDRYRPSFHTSLDTTLLPPSAVEPFMTALFSGQIVDFYELEGLEVSPWR